MLSDPVTLSLAALQPRIDACELCSVGPEALRNAVLVRHARGASVQLAACDRCAAGVRRLIAVAGGATASGPASVTFDLQTPPAASQFPQPSTDVSDLVGAPVGIHEYAEPLRADDGGLYIVRVFGQERSDGTWVGWLTFASPDGTTILKTGRETTQSSRDHLAYWATGLQPSYLEGAFRRAAPG